MKLNFTTKLLLLLLLVELYQSQSTSYVRVNQSCLLLSDEKKKCLLPIYNKYCCQNCNDLQINCQGVTRHKQVFFLAKFIDCPEGVIHCKIANDQAIIKSDWVKNFFRDEKDIDMLINLIEFQAISCEKDYILLGNICIKRENCSEVGVFNEKIYCSNCDEGYYLSGDIMNSCKKCKSYIYLNSLKDEIIETSNHCQICNDQNNCIQCIDGYNLFYDYNHGKHVCIKCQDNCRCNSEVACTNCVQFFFYRREYYSNDIDPIPLYETCEPCLPYIEEHMGPNLKRIIQIFNLKLEDLVLRCKGLSMERIELKNIVLMDIIEQPFTLNIYIINGQFETCPEGCAHCFFNERKQILQCIICLNGYYFDYTKENACQHCTNRNPDYQLCHGQRGDSNTAKVYPTQCKINFNQPILAESVIGNIYFDCTIQPMCILADQWTHNNKESRGSCKRCLSGYHKERLNPFYNYYQCVQTNTSKKTPGNYQNCLKGFYSDYHTGTCKPCPQNCLSCTSEGCEECDKTKAYSNILSNYSLECIVIQQDTSDVKHCMTFQSGRLNKSQERPFGGFCKQCKNGYEPIYENVEGTNIIVECKIFIEHCIQMKSPKHELINSQNKHEFTCTQCDFGYYLNNQSCEVIPKNCALFDTYLQKCQNCKYGFKLIRNECIQCTNINSINQVGYFRCLSTIQEIQLMNVSYIYS